MCVMSSPLLLMVLPLPWPNPFHQRECANALGSSLRPCNSRPPRSCTGRHCGHGDFHCGHVQAVTAVMVINYHCGHVIAGRHCGHVITGHHCGNQISIVLVFPSGLGNPFALALAALAGFFPLWHHLLFAVSMFSGFWLSSLVPPPPTPTVYLLPDSQYWSEKGRKLTLQHLQPCPPHNLPQLW